MKLTEKLNLVSRRRDWQLAALGNTEGSVTVKGKTIPLNRGSAATAPGRPTGSLRFECAKGSLGDSLDDFLFCYTEISPEKENFDLSALFTVREASETLSWQSGYGIFAVDTFACGSGQQRYRNHLGIGRFRTRSATRQSAGMRAAAGYRDEGAAEVCGRRTLDLSRDAAFPEQKAKITAGEQYRLRLKKTDDGFGAKLSIGEGNIFFECSAHHNADDGFDLFSKNVLGPIGAVTLENCVAYENGRRKEDRQEEKTGGMGFKLGGDHLAIPHRVKNCIAWGNLEAGFSTNNNPVTRMEALTAWQNGRTPLLYNYRLATGRSDIRPDGKCPACCRKTVSTPASSG